MGKRQGDAVATLRVKVKLSAWLGIFCCFLNPWTILDNFVPSFRLEFAAGTRDEGLWGTPVWTSIPRILL